VGVADGIGVGDPYDTNESENVPVARAALLNVTLLPIVRETLVPVSVAAVLRVTDVPETAATVVPDGKKGYTPQHPS
jgi:hypothetical protein